MLLRPAYRPQQPINGFWSLSIRTKQLKKKFSFKKVLKIHIHFVFAITIRHPFEFLFLLLLGGYQAVTQGENKLLLAQYTIDQNDFYIF